MQALHMAEDATQIAILGSEDARRILCASLTRCTLDRGLSARLHEYSNGCALLDMAASYDILFLCIGHDEEMDGIELARKLRRKDERCRLVLVAATGNYAEESYELRASYYLLLPIAYDSLQRALSACLDGSEDERNIEIVSARNRKKLNLSSIMYIKTIRNAVLLHTSCGNTSYDIERVYTSYRKLAPILLADSRFLECCYGSVLNMDHVQEMDRDAFVMKDNTRLPMRQRGAVAIRARYLGYAGYCAKTHEPKY